MKEKAPRGKGVGIKPSPERLCTEFARRKDVIEAAYDRSINSMSLKF